MESIELKQRHHFINLFSMAIADNNLDPSELKFLYELGLEKGLTIEQIDDIITNPHKARFVKPTSILEAINQLYDIVHMVTIDGKIHPHEVDLCKLFAKRFDINEEIIDELIEKLIDEILSGVNKENLLNEIKKTF